MWKVKMDSNILQHSLKNEKSSYVPNTKITAKLLFNPLGPIADLSVKIDSTYCRRHK